MDGKIGLPASGIDRGSGMWGTTPPWGGSAARELTAVVMRERDGRQLEITGIGRSSPTWGSARPWRLCSRPVAAITLPTGLVGGTGGQLRCPRGLTGGMWGDCAPVGHGRHHAAPRAN
jgi:hypothetical protein